MKSLSLDLDDLARDEIFKERLRFEITPEDLFKPRFAGSEEDHCDTEGYMFYVDYVERMPDVKPCLSVMKTSTTRSNTLGHVEGVPEELIMGAVKRDGARDMSGMWAIDEALEAWLRQRLGMAT